MFTKKLVGMMVIVLFCGMGAPAKAQETSGSFAGGSVKIGYDSRLCDGTMEGNLRYNSSSSCLEYCDGGGWVCPISPPCTDDASAECLLDATRANNDPEFAASNIKCGVNVLGVTGTLGTPSTSGLVHHWKLDETSGTTVSAAVGTDGILYNSAADPWNETGGKIGGALVVESADGYFRVNNPGLPTGDFTYALWVNFDDVGGSSTLFGASDGAGGDEFMVLVGGSQDVAVLFNDAIELGWVSFIPLANWTHIAVTRTGSTATLYVDGSDVASDASVAATLNFGTCPLFVGTHATAGCTDTLTNTLVQGRVDDVRIYNRGLSASEIEGLVTAGDLGCQ